VFTSVVYQNAASGAQCNGGGSGEQADRSSKLDSSGGYQQVKDTVE